MTPGCHIKLNIIELIEVINDVHTEMGLEKWTPGIIPVTAEEHHFRKKALDNHVQLKSNILSILNGMRNENYGVPNHIILKTERCLDGLLFKVDLKMHILVCIYS